MLFATNGWSKGGILCVSPGKALNDRKSQDAWTPRSCNHFFVNSIRPFVRWCSSMRLRDCGEANCLL